MQQWRELKRRHADALLLFRVGDFYEMFNEDAEEGSRLLDLTLTSRNNGSSRAPLAGVPAHSLDTYLERLIRLGRRVAILRAGRRSRGSKRNRTPRGNGNRQPGCSFFRTDAGCAAQQLSGRACRKSREPGSDTRACRGGSLHRRIDAAQRDPRCVG